MNGVCTSPDRILADRILADRIPADRIPADRVTVGRVVALLQPGIQPTVRSPKRTVKRVGSWWTKSP